MCAGFLGSADELGEVFIPFIQWTHLIAVINGHAESAKQGIGHGL